MQFFFSHWSIAFGKRKQLDVYSTGGGNCRQTANKMYIQMEKIASFSFFNDLLLRVLRGCLRGLKCREVQRTGAVWFDFTALWRSSFVFGLNRAHIILRRTVPKPSATHHWRIGLIVIPPLGCIAFITYI